MRFILPAVLFTLACAPEQPTAPSSRRENAAALTRPVLRPTADLRTDPDDGWSSVGSCVEAGRKTFCAIEDPVLGTELWVSDGTVPGTHPVVELSPGQMGWISTPMAAMGEHVYFVAHVPGLTFQLFRTDGTAAGTTRLPYEPGLQYITDLAVVGDTLFISGGDTTDGAELWRTRGVDLPVRLKDIAPGEVSGRPRMLTPVGTRVFFIAFTPATGDELWVSDGTSEGTRLVRDLRFGTSGAFPSSGGTDDLVALGASLLFRANDGVTGAELWRTDGTEVGTHRVKDFAPGEPGGMALRRTMTVLNGAVYFAAMTPETGEELFRTDGTEAGTVCVSDLVPGGSSFPGRPVVAGDRLYFLATSPATGREPHVSDGTPEGTFRLADVNPGAAASASTSARPAFVPVAGRTVIFGAFDPLHGTEPWVSDGTQAGTKLLRDVAPGAGDSVSSHEFMAFSAGGAAFFLTDQLEKESLWYRTDGTAAGLSVAHDPSLGTASLFPWEESESLAVRTLSVGDKLLFFADLEDGKGFELYGTDGTLGGTGLVKDLQAGRENGFNRQASSTAVYKGQGYFAAQATGTDLELWKTDGTAQGTVLVADVNPGPQGSMPQQFVLCRDQLFFIAYRPDVGLELFVTDGTSQGTRLAVDLNPGPANSIPVPLRCVGDELVFGADLPNLGRELVVSDGTPAGTRSFELSPGAPSTSLTELVVVGEDVYFAASPDPAVGSELYRWRRGLSSPRLVRDLWPGTNSGLSGAALTGVAVDGKLVFRASDPRHGEELWVSDGTTEGTQLLRDLAPGAASADPKALTVLGGQVFFRAHTDGFGEELWVTRGTRASTRLVKDVWPGAQSGVSASTLLPLEEHGILLFTGMDPSAGAELWRTDGTEAGTRRVEDTLPGFASLQPFRPVRAGKHVFVQGLTRAQGREWWVADVADLVDTTPPELACPASLRFEASSRQGGEVSWPAFEVAGADVTTDRQPGFYPLGPSTVRVTATDALGQSSSCTFEVLVRDTTPPVLVCPPRVEGGQDGAVRFSAEATDAVSPTVELTYSVSPGTRLAPGVTVITARARDEAGNTAQCAFEASVTAPAPAPAPTPSPAPTGCGCGVVDPASLSVLGLLGLALRRRR
jgi:ELWxxDGT repeat protein